MAVVVRYNPSSLTQEKYDTLNRLFMEKGQEMGQQGPPEDLLVHVAFGDDGSMMISEIWTSEDVWREQFDGFIGPILAEGGIQVDPQVHAAHSLWGSGVPTPPAPQAA